MTPLEPTTPADATASFLAAQGVRRIFGLCGGHVQSVWDAIARAGIEIVDVRHEGAAVHMAHAHAEVTGELGVAVVTAGPGLTNAVTAIANASVSRAPVLVLSGRAPRPQSGMHAMQDLPQTEVVAPLVRRAERLEHSRHLVDRLTRCVRAALGHDGHSGPAYLDLPADMWDEPFRPVPPDVQPGRVIDREPAPAPVRTVDEAVGLLAEATRPLVLSGRGASWASGPLARLLEASGAVHLDSSDSRGLLGDHPATVPAARGRAIAEADVVVTVGRVLDFQLGYGSAAVFADDARFVRIGRTDDELVANRYPDVEVRADIGPALTALADGLDAHDGPQRGTGWRTDLVITHARRAKTLARRLATASCEDDGRISPFALIREVNAIVGDDGFTVADGGDILSFARIALKAPRHLDCGPLGCLGVGTPFAVAAALARPPSTEPVVALIGDGSFGFTAMEVDTAVRHDAPVVPVIANNEAWNIERHDQLARFDGRLVGVDLPGCRYDLLARGLGAHAERVEDLADLPAALARARAHAPAVVDVLVSRVPTSPDFDSGLARVPSLQALTRWDEAEHALRV